MDDPHYAGIEWNFIPQNWSGEVIFRSGIDGNIINNGVERYSDLNGKHIEVLETGTFNDRIYLVSQTLQSKIRMAQAASLKVMRNEDEVQCKTDLVQKENEIYQDLQVDCSKLQPLRIEKIVSVFTSRDFAISDPLTEAKNRVDKAISFGILYKRQRIAWGEIWGLSNFELESGNSDSKILRLHIFHIHQTVSQNSIGRDIGVPSRGWHGEAYRGHIFWDELYLFPYINLHMPQLARSLLMYRYQRLPRARQAAKENGYKGAMFPWQSGSNGREESQVIHLNPKSGRWISR